MRMCLCVCVCVDLDLNKDSDLVKSDQEAVTLFCFLFVCLKKLEFSAVPYLHLNVTRVLGLAHSLLKANLHKLVPQVLPFWGSTVPFRPRMAVILEVAFECNID